MRAGNKGLVDAASLLTKDGQHRNLEPAGLDELTEPRPAQVVVNVFADRLDNAVPTAADTGVNAGQAETAAAERPRAR